MFALMYLEINNVSNSLLGCYAMPLMNKLARKIVGSWSTFSVCVLCQSAGGDAQRNPRRATHWTLEERASSGVERCWWLRMRVLQSSVSVSDCSDSSTPSSVHSSTHCARHEWASERASRTFGFICSSWVNHWWESKTILKKNTM